MQLSRNGSIRQALTAFTAALIGGASAVDASGPGRSETSFLSYSEDGRVRATEIMFGVTKQTKSIYTWNLRLTYDGLTGASPTGGSPSKQAQTLTRPSGGTTVLVPAGQIPVDKSFSESRLALDFDLSRPVGINSSIRGGLHLSSERDYKSVGLSGGFAHDFDNGRTTFAVSGSALSDNISPVNGVPTALDSTDAPIETQNGRRPSNGNGHKSTYSAVLSLTRIFTSTFLAKLGISVDKSSGYMTDPYKIVSVVQHPDSANAGEPINDLFERRPDSRFAQAISVDVRKHLLGVMAESNYRFFSDDWGVRSHTGSIAIKADFKRKGEIEPRVRYYQQNRADFSRPFLVQGAAIPDYISADSRLAAFDAITYGLTYTVPTSPTTRLSLSTEWYSQRGDKSPPEAFGPLLDIKLFPDLDAFMLRVGIAHDF